MNSLVTSSLGLGIVALAAPCERARFERGLAALARLGIRARVAGDPCAAYGTAQYLFASNSVQARVHALHDLIGDPSVHAILAARGAYGSAELLTHIDFDLVAKTKKTLIGFSDITALLVPWAQCARVPSIHGVTLESGFSKFDDDAHAQESARQLLSLLSKEARKIARSGSYLWAAHEAEIEGALIGGNLVTLATLCGTPWQLKGSEQILFIEEIRERPYRIHRALLQMRDAGCFAGLRAVVIGDMIECEHPKGAAPSWQEAVLSVFQPLRIPVLHLGGSGHGVQNLPLVFGVPVKIGADGTIHFSVG